MIILVELGDQKQAASTYNQPDSYMPAAQPPSQAETSVVARKQLDSGRGDLSGRPGEFLGVGAGAGFQRGGQRCQPFPPGSDGLQGAHLLDGVVGQCQAPGLPRPYVDLGEELGQGVAPTVVALTVGVHRARGEPLGGIKLAQVPLNPGGHEISAICMCLTSCGSGSRYSSVDCPGKHPKTTTPSRA